MATVHQRRNSTSNIPSPTLSSSSGAAQVETYGASSGSSRAATLIPAFSSTSPSEYAPPSSDGALVNTPFSFTAPTPPSSSSSHNHGGSVSMMPTFANTAAPSNTSVSAPPNAVSVTPFDASALLSKLRGSANTSNTSGSGNHRANGGTASKSGGGATPMSLSSSGNGNASGGLFTSGNNNAGTRDFVYESSNGVGSFAELVKRLRDLSDTNEQLVREAAELKAENEALRAENSSLMERLATTEAELQSSRSKSEQTVNSLRERVATLMLGRGGNAKPERRASVGSPAISSSSSSVHAANTPGSSSSNSGSSSAGRGSVGEREVHTGDVDANIRSPTNSIPSNNSISSGISSGSGSRGANTVIAGQASRDMGLLSSSTPSPSASRRRHSTAVVTTPSSANGSGGISSNRSTPKHTVDFDRHATSAGTNSTSPPVSVHVPFNPRYSDMGIGLGSVNSMAIPSSNNSGGGGNGKARRPSIVTSNGTISGMRNVVPTNGLVTSSASSSAGSSGSNHGNIVSGNAGSATTPGASSGQRGAVSGKAPGQQRSIEAAAALPPPRRKSASPIRSSLHPVNPRNSLGGAGYSKAYASPNAGTKAISSPVDSAHPTEPPNASLLGSPSGVESPRSGAGGNALPSNSGVHTAVTATNGSSPIAATPQVNGLEGLIPSLDPMDVPAESTILSSAGGGGSSTSASGSVAGGVDETGSRIDRIRRSINSPTAPVLLDIPIFEVNLTL